MNNQIKNNQLPFNLITWLISVVPIVLIFSNAIADIIVVTASLFFLYDSFKKNYLKWLNEPWVKISIIIYFWLIIVSLFAYDKELSASRAIPWIRFIIFSASLQFLFLIKNNNKKKLMIFTIIALIYVNIEMFVEYFTGTSLYSKFRVEFLNLGSFEGGTQRVSGPFKDAPKSGIFLAYFLFPIIFSINKLINKKEIFNKSTIIITLFLITNLFLVYLSGHRASILSVAISLSLIISYLLIINKNYKTIFLIFFLFLSSTFFISNSNLDKFNQNIINKTYSEIKNYSESAYGSLSLTSFKMFKANPIFGIGIKNYRVACEKDIYLSKGHMGTGYGVSPWKGHYNIGLKKYYEATCSSHPHNLYLTWLSETGLIGFILFIFFLCTLALKIIKEKKYVYKDLIFIGLVASLIPKLIPMMPSLNFFSNWNAICFWFLIGWTLSYLPVNKKS